MTVQPRPADRDERASMTDEELAAFIAALPPCPGLPSTDEEEEEADRRALDDIAHGRIYPHYLVVEWLTEWSRSGRKPFKDWLAERDG